MEAPQGVELTGTNRPDTLTTNYATWFGTESSSVCSFLVRDCLELRLGIAGGDHISGADSGGVPPVPIPNTAVKPASADGSWTAGFFESRSVPDYK